MVVFILEKINLAASKAIHAANDLNFLLVFQLLKYRAVLPDFFNG